jgi:hypothetical protein
VSRLVVAGYEPVRLDKVIVASGAVYETPGTSATTGDVYSGDMRENVGKAQVSTGVNLANFGTTSAPMTQRQPGTFNQRIIHHSAGAYTNGVAQHGLSGGNGMATLYDSVGNELSHELGHSYGLGHYPGFDAGLEGDARAINSSHHSESGWGYIAYRDRMRTNLADGSFKPDGVDVNGVPFMQSFAGQYNYNVDAMAGGYDASNLSRYTHHTGYSAARIQDGLRSVVPDSGYPSGYRDWSTAEGAWVDARTVDPAFSTPAPAEVGVPVFTLLGGYNPANAAQTVLYPAFRSNYGNTFDHPAPDTTGTDPARQCWMEVSHADGRVDNITVDASDGVKQVNINLAESADPNRARLLCRAAGLTTQLGSTVAIATELAPMAPAVVIGQEAGYRDLEAVEIPELDEKLRALVGDPTPTLDSQGLLLLESWADKLSGLSPEAQEVAVTLLRQRADAEVVDRFVDEHRTELDAGEPAAVRTLRDLLVRRGMVESETQVLPTGTRVTVDGGKCLAVDTAADPLKVVATTSPDLCTDGPEQRWSMDARGAIHSALHPELCIGAATPVSLAPCNARTQAQVWVQEEDGHLQSAAKPTSYLDLYRSTHQPGLYGRSTGSNQIWEGLTVSPNPALVTLHSDSLAMLARLEL